MKSNRFLGWPESTHPRSWGIWRAIGGMIAILALAICTLSPDTALAQDDDEEMTFEEDDGKDAGKDAPKKAGDDEPTFEDDDDDDGPEPDPGGDIPDIGDLTDPDAEQGTVKPVEAGKADVKKSWEDIVVVIRKPFLKAGRLEILPQFGLTMNDNLLRHFQFGAQLNYFVTDVLAVGLEGVLYQDDIREPFDLVARQARRLPTVNKYNYGASLNFHYVPIYGKFAVLDKHLVHWETYFTAGIGFTESEVLPRDPALQPFTNFLITPNIGANMRFFLTKWLTVNVGIRDYIFVDRFEANDRTEISGSMAKDNADSSLINNVVFQAGVSFWFPPSFEYTTFR